MSAVPLSEKREEERVAGAGGSSEHWRPLPRKEGGSAMIYAGLAVVVALLVVLPPIVLLATAAASEKAAMKERLVVCLRPFCGFA